MLLTGAVHRLTECDVRGGGSSKSLFARLLEFPAPNVGVAIDVERERTVLREIIEALRFLDELERTLVPRRSGEPTLWKALADELQELGLRGNSTAHELGRFAHAVLDEFKEDRVRWFGGGLRKPQATASWFSAALRGDRLAEVRKELKADSVITGLMRARGETAAVGASAGRHANVAVAQEADGGGAGWS